MTWWQRIWGRWGNGHDAAQIRADAAKERQFAEGMTPLVERAADRLARLSADEFAARVARAFQVRAP